MTKQDGFTAAEAVLIIVFLVFVGSSGYLVWHHKQTSERASVAAASTASTQLTYSPPVTVPSVPAVTNAAGLTSALQVLNETDVTASSTDSAQLGSQASAF
jgi:hypothetical protein